MSEPVQATLPEGVQPSLSLAEAAEALGIAPKTLRRRIKAGTVPAELHEGPHGPEYRIPAAAVQPSAAPAAADPSPVLRVVSGPVQATPPSGNGGHVQATLPTDHPSPVQGTLPNTHEMLRAALDREAALLQEVTELRRVRDEVTFLRVRLEASEQNQRETREALLQELRTERERSAESERELRVLLLRAQETAQALTERIGEIQQALPAPTPPRPWWKLWG